MRPRRRFRRSWRVERRFSLGSTAPGGSTDPMGAFHVVRHRCGYTLVIYRRLRIGESPHATMAKPMSADMQHCIHSEKVSANERLPQPPRSRKSNVRRHGSRQSRRFIGESANRICTAPIRDCPHAAAHVRGTSRRSPARRNAHATTTPATAAEGIAVLL